MAASAPARSVRDAVVFHGVFAAVCVAALALPVSLGWTLLALVAGYNVALPLVGRARGHGEWVALWAFLLPLSVFQVVPDAFLSSVLGVLDFPDTGGPRVSGVPLAMAGMWAIALWPPLFAADRLARRPVDAAWWAAGLAALVLVSSEATLWALPIWQAIGGVATIGPVALYVVPPEILLGGVAYLGYRLTEGEGWPVRVGTSLLVALVYLGALAASYLVIEGA